MPTGYTESINKGINFEDFVLQCARAFGALVGMRDMPFDAEIPFVIKPHTYHRDELARAKRRLTRIEDLTIGVLLERSKILAKREHTSGVRRATQWREEVTKLREKYEDMLEKIRVWEPPTPEHMGLKKFMVEQVERSIEFDCSPERYKDPDFMTSFEHLAKRITKIGEDIDYHSRNWDEEVRRAAEKTEWIKQLRESLGLPSEAKITKKCKPRKQKKKVAAKK